MNKYRILSHKFLKYKEPKTLNLNLNIKTIKDISVKNKKNIDINNINFKKNVDINDIDYSKKFWENIISK